MNDRTGGAGKEPLEVNTKGKLSIDLRVQTGQGLCVRQTGVDTTGARYVGDVGMSVVTP